MIIRTIAPNAIGLIDDAFSNPEYPRSISTSLDGQVPGACPAGQICQTGACANACAIGGSYFTENAANPQNSCQTCQSARSNT